jgi:hypothetical protein
MLANKFRFIWQSGFRGEGLKKSVNQKQELSVVAMFVNGCVPYGASFSVLSFLIHLANANVSFCHHLASVVR